MSSASTSATSTNSVHTERSTYDRRIAAAEPILRPQRPFTRLRSDGATFSADCSTNTKPRREDRVCAPHGVPKIGFRLQTSPFRRRSGVGTHTPFPSPSLLASVAEQRTAARRSSFIVLVNGGPEGKLRGRTPLRSLHARVCRRRGLNRRKTANRRPAANDGTSFRTQLQAEARPHAWVHKLSRVQNPFDLQGRPNKCTPRPYGIEKPRQLPPTRCASNAKKEMSIRPGATTGRKTSNDDLTSGPSSERALR